MAPKGKLMYTALHLPSSDRDKEGFATEQDAIDWIVDNHLCSMCIDEGWGSSCAAEWMVVETVKLKNCKDLGDVFEAAGCEKVEEWHL